MLAGITLFDKQYHTSLQFLSPFSILRAPVTAVRRGHRPRGYAPCLARVKGSLYGDAVTPVGAEAPVILSGSPR